MKRIVNYLMKRKSVLNAFVVVGGTMAMMAREGFCFIFSISRNYQKLLEKRNNGKNCGYNRAKYNGDTACRT